MERNGAAKAALTICSLALALIAVPLLCVTENAHAAHAARPGKAKIVYAKGAGAGKIAVKVRKTKRAGGYQIKVAGNRKMTKAVRVKRTRKRVLTLKGLPQGKRVWVKTRAYRKAGKRTRYGKWSAAKAVTVPRASVRKRATRPKEEAATASLRILNSGTVCSGEPLVIYVESSTDDFALSGDLQPHALGSATFDDIAYGPGGASISDDGFTWRRAAGGWVTAGTFPQPGTRSWKMLAKGAGGRYEKVIGSGTVAVADRAEQLDGWVRAQTAGMAGTSERERFEAAASALSEGWTYNNFGIGRGGEGADDLTLASDVGPWWEKRFGTCRAFAAALVEIALSPAIGATDARTASPDDPLLPMHRYAIVAFEEGDEAVIYDMTPATDRFVDLSHAGALPGGAG